MAWKLQRHSFAPGLSIRKAIAIRPLLHLIVVLAMLALFSGQARAYISGDVTGIPDEIWNFCKTYADEAGVAAVMNENLRCGYTGPRYSRDNAVGHVRWCMKHTRDEAERETKSRNDEIARCSACNEYGKKANGQANENAIFHCGGGGPRWDSGEHHKKWCMSLRDPRGTSDAETGARQQALNQCKEGKYTRAQLDECTEYAGRAVKQAKFNAEHKCGGTGDRWSLNRDEHFAFCTFGWLNKIGGTDVITAMKQESDARDAENFRCKAPFEDKVKGNVKSGAQNDPVRVFDRNVPVVGSLGKPTMPPIATPPSSTTLPIRVPPPAVPAVPRQPSSLPPVMTSTGSGGVVPPWRPVPSLPAPGGATDWWKQKLPPVVFQPRPPSGIPPVNSGGAANKVPPPKPVPPTPTVPGRPSGGPPASGGIVLKPKPLPSDVITAPATNGRPSGRSDPAVISKYRPVPSSVISSKPPADAPRLGNNGTKGAGPLALKYRPVASSPITAKGSSAAALPRIEPAVRTAPVRPPIAQGRVNRLSVGQDPLRLR